MSLVQGLKKLFGALASKSTDKNVDHAVYAVGDVHGYDKALESMISSIKEDIKTRKTINPKFSAEIVFCGDYVSRGPNSKRVIEILCNEMFSQKQDGIQRTFLAGNHDISLMQFLESKMPTITTDIGRDMLDYGGLQTAASYGVYPQSNPHAKGAQKLKGVNLFMNQADLLDFQDKMRKAVPLPHLLFLKNLKTSYQTDQHPEFFFCHAGVDWTKPYTEQKNNVLLGMGDHIEQQISRDFARHTDGAKDIIVVHGHTIRNDIECRSGRISIDTGVFTKKGHLSCSILAEGQMIGSLTVNPKAPAYNRKEIPIPKQATFMSQPLDAGPQ